VNSQQVGEILAYFSAAWPRHEMYEETVQVWLDQFQRTDFEVAQVAAKQIVEKEEWFPSVSRFKREVRDVMRRDQLASWGRSELESAAGDWREGLELARKTLRGDSGE